LNWKPWSSTFLQILLLLEFRWRKYDIKIRAWSLFVSIWWFFFFDSKHFSFFLKEQRFSSLHKFCFCLSWQSINFYVTINGWMIQMPLRSNTHTHIELIPRCRRKIIIIIIVIQIGLWKLSSCSRIFFDEIKENIYMDVVVTQRWEPQLQFQRSLAQFVFIRHCWFLFSARKPCKRVKFY
jgi:hypothetical protein